MTQMGLEFQQVGIEDSLREAQYLLTRVLEMDELELLRREREIPNSTQAQKLWEFFKRRRSREPMAYLFEEHEFFGRNFKVGKGALIPRPETEHLIEWVKETHLDQPYQNGIDFCAGPGTIGMTLALELKCPFTLVELSPKAMKWAGINLDKLDLSTSVKLILDDVTCPLPLNKVDLLVSNPPYVPSGDLPNLQVEVRDYEPSLALDGGVSGLEFMQRMMKNAQSLALPGCHFYLELGLGHRDLLRSCDFGPWQCDGWRHDLARIPRIVRYTFKP
jgi:release factor glutamine methyltransferase